MALPLNAKESPLSVDGAAPSGPMSHGEGYREISPEGYTHRLSVIPLLPTFPSTGGRLRGRAQKTMESLGGGGWGRAVSPFHTRA